LDYTAQHVLLSATALGLGVAISLPLAIIAARRARLRWAVLAVASLVQTIPGLALFYPLLLALSALTGALFGFGVPALGFLPSVLALTVYSMLPILRNGVTAILGVDPACREAADGVGMTASQKLFRVELPLALKFLAPIT
jgi:osmoprotectant transport system permease protein